MSELLRQFSDVIEDIPETTAYTQEMHELWSRIREIRFTESISKEERNIELLRLFEVHNTLDIELQRLQEDYMNNFINSLKLEEINAVPYVQGKIKCRIDLKMPDRKGRSVSLNMKGVLQRKDSFPGYETIKNLTQQTAKDIADMQTRRGELIDDLVRIERKKIKTREDRERLNEINEILKMQKDKIRGV